MSDATTSTHDAGGDPGLGRAPARRVSEAFAGQPVPEISRVKRDDHPHWKVVAYMFHTRAGDRVLVDRGDGRQSRARWAAYARRAEHDELLVDLDGVTWACARADGERLGARSQRPGAGRDPAVPVARPARRRLGRPERWTLQTNMQGQP